MSKLANIIQATEDKVAQLNYAQIQHYFENIPECHHQDIERAVRTRSTGQLGMIIMMAIYQQIQDEVKDEHR